MNHNKEQYDILAPFELIKKDAATVIGDEKSIIIEGYASYCGSDSNGRPYVDLHGDILSVDGCDLSVWSMNSVILMNHDREKVIGKGLSIEKRPDGLFVQCEIFKDATDPQDWYRLSNGLITTFSIGFRSLDGMSKQIEGLGDVWIITKSLLLEISCVGIPASSMSRMHRVKELGNLSIEHEEHTNQEEITMTNIKVKRADLLSEKELEQFKALGGNEAEELEVPLASYIKRLVAEAFAEAKAADESKAKEAKELAEKEAAELAQKEADEAAKAEAETKAAEDAAKLEEEAKAAEEISELKEIIATIKSAIVEQK